MNEVISTQGNDGAGFSRGSIKWETRGHFWRESKGARASTGPKILAKCWRDVRTRTWLSVRGFQSLGSKCWQYPIRRWKFVQCYLVGTTPARTAVEYLLQRHCWVPLCRDKPPVLEGSRVLTGPYKSWLWLLCGFGKSSAAKKQKISNLRNSPWRTSQSYTCSSSWQLRLNSISEYTKGIE